MAHLWSYPPEQEAVRYVDFMGGADAVLAKARDSFAAGDLRWTATLVSHVVFADTNNSEARELLARTLEQLGHGAENGLWRNIYLRGAAELRAAEASVCIDWVFTDLGRTYRTELSNGALIHSDAGYGMGEPGLTVTLTRPQLIGVIAAGQLGSVTHEGDGAQLVTLLTLLDTVEHQFPMVTP